MAICEDGGDLWQVAFAKLKPMLVRLADAWMGGGLRVWISRCHRPLNKEFPYIHLVGLRVSFG